MPGAWEMETLKADFASSLYQSKMMDNEKPSQVIMNITKLVIKEVLKNSQSKDITSIRAQIMESLLENIDFKSVFAFLALEIQIT